MKISHLYKSLKYKLLDLYASHKVLSWIVITIICLLTIYPIMFLFGYNDISEMDQVLKLCEIKDELDKKIIALSLAKGDTTIRISADCKVFQYNRKEKKLEIFDLDSIGTKRPFLVWLDSYADTICPSHTGYSTKDDDYAYFDSFKHMFNVDVNMYLKVIQKSADQNKKKMYLQFFMYLGAYQGFIAHFRQLQQKYYNFRYGYDCFYDDIWWNDLCKPYPEIVSLTSSDCYKIIDKIQFR